MEKKPHKALTEIVKNSEKLLPLFAHAKLLEQLNKAVLTILPLELARHCQVINLQHHTLIIAAENATWATTLRYQCAEILTTLRGIAPNIANIRITVQPKEYKTIADKPIIRHLSAAVTEQLKSCAQGIEHPELKKALENLAKPTVNANL